MKPHYICALLSTVLLASITGCQTKKKTSENPEASGIKAKALKAQNTLKPNKNLLLAQPFRLKYDDKTNHLFINDLAQQKIIEINDSSTIVQTYGSKGKGPGELLLVENFFITPKYLFIIDSKQLLINKYSRRDGQYVSSLDYGKYLFKEKNISKNGIPPAPPDPWSDNNNKPFVTLHGTVLLPTQTGGKFLYKEISWKGKNWLILAWYQRSMRLQRTKISIGQLSEIKEFHPKI